MIILDHIQSMRPNRFIESFPPGADGGRDHQDLGIASWMEICILSFSAHQHDTGLRGLHVLLGVMKHEEYL